MAYFRNIEKRTEKGERIMGIRLSKRQFLSIALIGLILISLLMTVGMTK